MNNHPELIFAIETAFAKLEREKVNPWMLLPSNKMQPIEDFHGKVIQYTGVKFEGSPAELFWNDFIEPFLEALIGWGFKLAFDHAKEHKLNAGSCINVAQQALQNGVSKIYDRMQDIDRRLRGSGYPNTVPMHDILAAKRTMFKKITEYKASAAQAGAAQNEVPGGETEKERAAKMPKANTRPAIVWKDIKNEYHVSKRTFGKKINFVKDPFKKKILFRDIEHAYFLANYGFYKPAVILAGSVIEELLRLYLEGKNIKLERNTLDCYIKTCVDKGILKAGIYKLADSVRDFRNIVHLEREKTSRYTIERPTAKGAVASIFTIVNDFEKSV
jgi:hypothetical protein